MSSMTNPGAALRGPQPSYKPKISGYDTVSNFTPQQMQLFQDLFSHVGPDSYLSKLAGGDQGTFDQMEAPAKRQFSGLQGNIASRFSGMGSGARNSSGFQNTITSAASNFAQDLQSQRQGLQSQALRDLMGASDSLLGKQPYSYMQKKKPFWQELLGSLAGAGGQLGGNIGTMKILQLMGLV